jgi:hypothetical protein
MDDDGLEPGRSHPTPLGGYLSDTDGSSRSHPEARYILVSLADRADPVIRSFFIVDGAVTERSDDHMTQPFTEEQVQRYARHIILPNIGGADGVSCSTRACW